MTARCVRCGDPIPPGKRSDTVYCGKTCQKADYCEIVKAATLDAKRDRAPCLHCGAPIPANAAAHRAYCDRQCQRRGRYRLEKAALARACVICGGTYLASPAKQKTCGTSCAVIARRRADPIDCLHCEAEIVTPNLGQKFCNSRCQQRWHRAQRKG